MTDPLTSHLDLLHPSLTLLLTLTVLLDLPAVDSLFPVSISRSLPRLQRTSVPILATLARSVSVANR